MNRLWVRLSVVISALILVAALIPTFAFLSFVLTHEAPGATAVTAAPDAPPPPPDPDPQGLRLPPPGGEPHGPPPPPP